MKLRTQIVLVLALGTLLPLFATGYFFYRISVTRLNERADVVLQSLTRRIASDIDAFAQRATENSRTDGMMASLVDYVQAPPEVRAARAGIISELLRTTAIHDPVNIASCALFDREGRLLLDTASQTLDQPETDRAWIRLPLQTGLPTLVPELADPAFRGLWVSSPIRDSTGVIVGVIRQRYQIAVLQQLVSSISEFTNGAVYAEIIDNHGTVLADGGRPARVGEKGRLVALMSPPGQARLEQRLSIEWDPATPGPGPRARLATGRLQHTAWTLRVHVSAPFYNLATNELRRVALALGGRLVGVAVLGLAATGALPRPGAVTSGALTLLAAVAAVVDHDPVAGLSDAKFLGERRRGQQQMPEHRLVGRRGLADARNEFLRDDQHMHRRLRVDVMERQRPLVFVNRLVGDLAAQDAREDVVVVIVGNGSNGHGCSSLGQSPALKQNSPRQTSTTGLYAACKLRNMRENHLGRFGHAA